MKWWQRFKAWFIDLLCKQSPLPSLPSNPVPEPLPEPEPEIIIDDFTPEKYVEYYRNLWDTMEIRSERKSTIQWYVNQIDGQAEARYRGVEGYSGVPWQVVAAIHCLESAFRFDSVLHNGEKLEKVNRHGTTLVPKGRGQGKNWTWEQAAVDAFSIKDQPKVWNVENTLYFLERYNGLGYLRDSRKPNSPYLWSFTKHYFRGKYVVDGGYSSTAVSKQIGAAVLLKELGFLS